MVEIDSWDEKLQAEYREQQEKRQTISLYVEGEKNLAMAKGKEKGREEVRQKAKEAREEEALRMIDLGLNDEVVLKTTLLSPEHLEEIKRKNNK